MSVVQEELPDCPLYYSVDHLCGVLHCNTPSLVQIRSAVIEAGYRASSSHACKQALKTDASHNGLYIVKFYFHALNGLLSITTTCNFAMFSDLLHIHMDMTGKKLFLCVLSVYVLVPNWFLSFPHYYCTLPYPNLQ